MALQFTHIKYILKIAILPSCLSVEYITNGEKYDRNGVVRFGVRPIEQTADNDLSGIAAILPRLVNSILRIHCHFKRSGPHGK